MIECRVDGYVSTSVSLESTAAYSPDGTLFKAFARG
jgi:hypothetical protein